MADRYEAPPALKWMLAEVVDSSEKLDVIVYLHRARFGAKTTKMIAAALSLPSHAVAEALSALLHAGLVRTTDQDGAGWWLDPNNPSAATLETLVTLYDPRRSPQNRPVVIG